MRHHRSQYQIVEHGHMCRILYQVIKHIISINDRPLSGSSSLVNCNEVCLNNNTWGGEGGDAMKSIFPSHIDVRNWRPLLVFHLHSQINC